MQKLLTPERALIFRITHRDNLKWILDNGLHCASSNSKDPNFTSIGNPDLIDKRAGRYLPSGATLADYVPFYFTPRSPMLYNIKTGYNGIRQRRNEEIIVFVSSLLRLRARAMPFLFSDRHAYLAAARFFDELEMLKRIDWKILQNSDFKRDNDDLGKMERYQAEALVHQHVPLEALQAIVCFNEPMANAVNKMLDGGPLSGKAVAKPGWYF